MKNGYNSQFSNIKSSNSTFFFNKFYTKSKIKLSTLKKNKDKNRKINLCYTQ